MKREKVDTIIREFVIFGKNGVSMKTSNDSLMHEVGVLVNYNTIIGVKLCGTVVLNCRKYSVTTSKNQNKIRRFCNEMSIPVIEVDERCIEMLANDVHSGKYEHKLLQNLIEDIEKSRIDMFRIIGKDILSNDDIKQLEKNKECLKIKVVGKKYHITVKDDRNANGQMTYLSNKEAI